MLEKLKKIVKDKTVLDVGAVQHDWKTIKSTPKPFMHEELCFWSRKVIGIDIEPYMIDRLKWHGYDIRFMDAEKIKFDKDIMFDVVFAGDVIEHLGNPQKFLEGAKTVLKEEGILFLTTCNPFSILRLMWIAKHRHNKVFVRDQHTCWFCPTTLSQLVERAGFKVIEVGYYNWLQQAGWLRRFINRRFTRKAKEFDDMFYLIARVKK